MDPRYDFQILFSEKSQNCNNSATTELAKKKKKISIDLES
jgi:hypothetical protein